MILNAAAWYKAQRNSSIAISFIMRMKLLSFHFPTPLWDVLLLLFWLCKCNTYIETANEN